MRLYSLCPLSHPLQAALIGQGCLGPAVDLDGAGPSAEQVRTDADMAAAAAAVAPITSIAAIADSPLQLLQLLQPLPLS